jgi:nuclear pore complex protein Nup188
LTALVVKIFETAYATSIGTEQANATMILDDEGRQLRQDATAIWILLLLEVLELERVGTRVDFSEKRDPTLYTSSPAALAAIHELVMQNQDGRYACVYLAWAYVLSRLITVKTEMEPVAEAYKTFFNSIAPRQDRSYPGGVESLPLHMARSCLSPAAGLFETMHGLLTASPLFVTSQAWKAGSSITDPNAVGFRSVFKGLS